jgi:hypothetical protein
MTEIFNKLFQEEFINGQLLFSISINKCEIKEEGEKLMNTIFKLFLKYHEREQIDKAMKIKKIMFNLSQIIDETLKDDLD